MRKNDYLCTKIVVVVLKRKIEKLLSLWKQTNKALLIDGARQVGKTFILKDFARRNFASVVYINLYENIDAVAVLSQARDANDFILRLSALVNTPLGKGETVIFLDEIQELTRTFDLMTMSKFLVDEGSYRYMFSGSMLGVELTDAKSWPVGYLIEESMYPLDFEEFLWANGVNQSIIDRARECFAKKEPIEDYLHDKLMQYFKYYILVGGMPDAVNAFIDSADLNRVSLAHKAIQGLNKKDIAKYAGIDERLKIKQIYDLIPEELNSKSKRFLLSDITDFKRGDDIMLSFGWLQKAGVAIPIFNTTEALVPLKINTQRSTLKLMMGDVGLLTYELMDADVKSAVLQGRLDVNEGAICENVCAQLLLAHGFDQIFYFNSKRLGEVDFLVQYKGNVLPVEVKSGGYFKKHTALDNLMSVPNYSLSEAYVFVPSNVERENGYTYFPLYMMEFLQKRDRYFLND